MARRRSLWPREHGAYAQLGAPLLCALLVRAPTLPAILVASGAVFAFLANEPLLVVLGHRGRRMLETESGRARVRLTCVGSLALLAGVSGLVLGGPRVIVAAGIVAAPALALILLAYRRSLHSLGGEILAAVALPGLAVPAGVASGIALGEALVLWTAWSAAYVASVVAVQHVIARHRRAAAVSDRGLAASFLASTLGVALLAMRVDIALVAIPLLAVTTLIVLFPPRATHLRTVGVALVAMSSISVALAAAVL